MHPNLERHFVNLEVARAMLPLKVAAMTTRFHLLFENLAKDMGISQADLARRLGWEPFADGGNRISRGEADPSPEDCYRLTDIYLAFMDKAKPKMNTDSDESRPEKVDPRETYDPEINLHGQLYKKVFPDEHR